MITPIASESRIRAFQLLSSRTLELLCEEASAHRPVSLPRFQGQCSESCFYTGPMKTNDHNECPVYATPSQR